jgi:hypothetical protein
MAEVRRELDRKQVCTDHVVDKPFLRSVRYLNQEIVATHQSRLEFFVQVIEKRQGEIISIFRFFVDINLPTKRSIAMTSITKKQGDMAMKMKVDSSVADGKEVSLGGGRKPLKVKLNQSSSTADKKQVRIGGGRSPLRR